MKKVFLIALFLLVFLPKGYAEPVKDNFDGFYGLFEEISKIMVDDLQTQVNTSDANKIINLFFEESPFKGEAPLRKELLVYLSEKCNGDITIPPLEFKDAGLLDKDLRKAYSVLKGNGKLYYDGDFLSPESFLTYDYLIGSLSLFEDEILSNLQISKSEGMIRSVSLQKRITGIKLLMPYSTAKIEFIDMETKNIYKHGYFEPYCKNLATGDRVIIYTDKDGKGLYVKFPDENFSEFTKLNKDYTLYKGDIYYIDKDFAIVKNAFEFDGHTYNELQNEIYQEFKTDKGTIFKHNTNPTDFNYINENLLDKTVFVICDKLGNAKYINLWE